MDNNNNQNHNGKEVNRDQTLRNGQKGSGSRPVNRIKKNNTPSDKEVRPSEPKKITLNTNRPAGNPKRSIPKGQVIKLGEGENIKQPVDTPVRENRRTYPRNASANNINTTTTETPYINKPNDTSSQRTPDKETFSISDRTGNWLLMAAVLLFIAWLVVFFYYHIGGNSHMLLAFAVICAVISLAGKRRK